MDNTKQDNANQQTSLSQQQTEQPQTSPSSSSAPSKTFMILIIVILIATVGVGGYFLGTNQNQVVQNSTQAVIPTTQPSPIPADQTANWKTYKDPKYNFLFNYPPAWSAGDGSSCTHGLYSVYLKYKNNYCESEITISVTPKDNEDTCFPISLSVLSRKNLSVADLPAQMIVIENPRGTQRNETAIGFEKDNYCYSIINREQLVSEKTFDQILSTFKFTP